jgi:hypothetical protein
VFKISLKGTSLSDNDVDHTVTIKNLTTLCLTYDRNQNRHTEDPVEHTGPFFNEVAYYSHDILSKMF